MVERHWRGISIREKAEQYIHHLTNETLPDLKALPGFKSLSILRREVREGTAFLIITRWETLEDMRSFAGIDLESAVVPDLVKSIMIKFDSRVEHFNVVHQSESSN
ncbi:MAG TPA: hypothetical protein VFZ52_10515 [Chryseolinea sp.]